MSTNHIYRGGEVVEIVRAVTSPDLPMPLLGLWGTVENPSYHGFRNDRRQMLDVRLLNGCTVRCILPFRRDRQERGCPGLRP